MKCLPFGFYSSERLLRCIVIFFFFLQFGLLGVFLPSHDHREESVFSWLKLKFHPRKFNLKFLTHVVGNYSLITCLFFSK